MKTVNDAVTALVSQFGPEDVLSALAHTLKIAENDCLRGKTAYDCSLYFRALWEGIETLQRAVLVAEVKVKTYQKKQLTYLQPNESMTHQK